jgi:hypothetical protein
MSLTTHWELKIVAMVLAVALYVYTSGQVRVERTVTVTVSDTGVKGLPTDYQVVGITPREFKVQLSVPTSRLSDLESTAIVPRLEIRPEHLAAREALWPLTSFLLQLPNDIRIESTEPPDVREISLRLDRVVEGTLAVEPPHLAGLQAGLDASIKLETTLARIAAGGDVLEVLHRDHERVRFQDVDLRSVPANLTAERQERLILTPLAPAQETPYQVLDPIRALITVRPIMGLARELSVPVKLLAGKDLLRSIEVTLTPPRVALTVRGPENQLAALTSEAMTAFVRLPDDIAPDAAARELPVEVLAPGWLIVEPATVRIAISPWSKP